MPTLAPGQVVVMDNLPAHKSPQIDRLVEAAGARVLRLPPYSPDFNPIEMAISKIKTVLLREKAWGYIRDAQALLDQGRFDNARYLCGYAVELQRMAVSHAPLCPPRLLRYNHVSSSGFRPTHPGARP